MSPIIYNFNGFELRWYPVLILLGVFLAYVLIMSEAKRHKIKPDFMFNLVFWNLIFGILGARIYYVIFNYNYYINNLSEIIKVWNGGLAIHGGIIAGVITTYVYCKKYDVNIRKIFDILAPGLLLAQGIGRWGNFFNAEAYGSIVSYKTLVNMKIIPSFVIDNMLINGEYHLPMFYFESLICILGVIIMLIIRRRRYIKSGEVVGFYLIWYGIARFIIESFRTDSLMLFDFRVARIVSVLIVFIGAYVIISQKQKPKLEDLYNKQENDIIF